MGDQSPLSSRESLTKLVALVHVRSTGYTLEMKVGSRLVAQFKPSGVDDGGSLLSMLGTVLHELFLLSPVLVVVQIANNPESLRKKMVCFIGNVTLQ